MRSSLHVSPKNLRISKWSYNGKNGPKHPMLSISITDDLISCKKIKRNSEKVKIADFVIFIWLPTSGNTKKKPSLNRDLLKSLYRYGIFWMVPGESSMSRRFRICVAKVGRGTGCFRLSYRQPKFTLFKKKNAFVVLKKTPLPKSLGLSLPMQITSSHRLWEEVFNFESSISKIVGVVFFNTSYFC